MSSHSIPARPLAIVVALLLAVAAGVSTTAVSHAAPQDTGENADSGESSGLLGGLLGGDEGSRSSDAGSAQTSSPPPGVSPAPAPTQQSGTSTSTSDSRRATGGSGQDSGSSSSQARSQDDNTLEPGDEGKEVARVQRRLRSLGYWLGSADGSYDELTQQAVYAFQGVADLPVDGIIGPRTRRALANARRPDPHGGGGDRLEIDIADQTLTVVRDGRTAWVMHVATGTGGRYQHPDGHTAIADTPRGRWEISRRVDGWRESDLGVLYRPAYFHPDGLAIHGSHAVPPHRISHGCVRVTDPAMDFLWQKGFVPVGRTVLVH